MKQGSYGRFMNRPKQRRESDCLPLDAKLTALVDYLSNPKAELFDSVFYALFGVISKLADYASLGKVRSDLAAAHLGELLFNSGGAALAHHARYFDLDLHIFFLSYYINHFFL